MGWAIPGVKQGECDVKTYDHHLYSLPCLVARDGNICAILALLVIFLTGNIFVEKLLLMQSPLHK